MEPIRQPVPVIPLIIAMAQKKTAENAQKETTEYELRKKLGGFFGRDLKFINEDELKAVLDRDYGTFTDCSFCGTR